jgi:hypothetical protein
MRNTLRHFPTLNVVVTQVEEALAVKEENEIAARLAESQPTVVHLLSEADPSRTEYGLPDKEANWMKRDLWKLSGPSNKCASRLAACRCGG